MILAEKVRVLEERASQEGGTLGAEPQRQLAQSLPRKEVGPVVREGLRSKKRPASQGVHAFIRSDRILVIAGFREQDAAVNDTAMAHSESFIVLFTKYY